MTALVDWTITAAYFTIGWCMARPVARRVYLAEQSSTSSPTLRRQFRQGDLAVATGAAVGVALAWPLVGVFLLFRRSVGRTIPEYQRDVTEDRQVELQEKIEAQAAEITRLHRIIGVSRDVSP